MWDALSKETLSVIQGFHTKGVCAVNFSCNGKLLVTVGIDAAHSIAVWKWAEGEYIYVSCTISDVTLMTFYFRRVNNSQKSWKIDRLIFKCSGHQLSSPSGPLTMATKEELSKEFLQRVHGKGLEPRIPKIRAPAIATKSGLVLVFRLIG